MCSAMCVHVCDQNTHNLVITFSVANTFCTLWDSYKEAAEEMALAATPFNHKNPKHAISSSIMTNYFSGNAHFQVIYNHYHKKAFLFVHKTPTYRIRK